MKITKSRLREIIKEEIKDFKSEQKLRKQIRELSGGSTTLGGAKRGDYKSNARNKAQTTSDKDSTVYNTTKAYHNTKSSEYVSKAKAFTTKSDAYSKKSGAYTKADDAYKAVTNSKFRIANRRAAGGLTLGTVAFKSDALAVFKVDNEL